MLHKLIWPIAFIAAFAVPVYAQQPSSFKLEVTSQELDVLAKGLESQPYKDVVPLLQKLREQITAQQQPIPVPKPAPEPKE